MPAGLERVVRVRRPDRRTASSATRSTRTATLRTYGRPGPDPARSTRPTVYARRGRRRRSGAAAPSRQAVLPLARLPGARTAAARATPTTRRSSARPRRPRATATRSRPSRCPQPPSFNEADVSDKPAGASAGRTDPRRARAAAIRENYQQRLESLLAVDEGVAGSSSALRASGELRQHARHLHLRQRLLARRAPHPQRQGPAVRAVDPGAADDARARRARGRHARRSSSANVDLAPTILDAAGATPGGRRTAARCCRCCATAGREWGRDLLLESGDGGANGSSYGDPHLPVRVLRSTRPASRSSTTCSRTPTSSRASTSTRATPRSGTSSRAGSLPSRTAAARAAGRGRTPA